MQYHIREACDPSSRLGVWKLVLASKISVCFNVLLWNLLRILLGEHDFLYSITEKRKKKKNLSLEIFFVCGLTFKGFLVVQVWDLLLEQGGSSALHSRMDHPAQWASCEFYQFLFKRWPHFCSCGRSLFNQEDTNLELILTAERICVY